MDEVVVVNEQDEVVGTMPRAQAHRDGTPHRIAVVYVENPSGNGEVLVQVRISGRLDHSAAGHVDVGEEYIDAATRELREELGIADVALVRVGHGVSEEIMPTNTHNEHRVHVMDIFSCVSEPGQLQVEEVERVYWADPHAILAQMQSRLDDIIFSGGFRTSLPIYLAAKAK